MIIGKHLKIENNDIITVYAHCRDLNVKQGDEVKQGQKIAEVGSTRKFYSDHIYILKLED